jgi:hypothetical protein
VKGAPFRKTPSPAHLLTLEQQDVSLIPKRTGVPPGPPFAVIFIGDFHRFPAAAAGANTEIYAAARTRHDRRGSPVT